MNREEMCSVVKDLLPLYAEELTTDDTNRVIEEHIENCSECRQEYRMLQEDTMAESEAQNEIRQQEINYLEKLKTYQNINLILGAVISFFFGACLPPALVVISIVSRGGIPDYYLARLQIAWHIGLLKMLLWGTIACAGYLIIMFLVKRVIGRKR